MTAEFPRSRYERIRSAFGLRGITACAGALALALTATGAAADELTMEQLQDLMQNAPPAPMPYLDEGLYPDDVSSAPGWSDPVQFDLETGQEVIVPSPATAAPASGDPPLRAEPGEGSGIPDDGSGLAAFLSPSELAEVMDGVSGLGPVQDAITPTPPSPLSDARNYPYRTVAKMLMRFNVSGTNYYYVCSAELIAPHHALTAGHCIFNHDPNGSAAGATPMWASEVWVWPAQSELSTATNINRPAQPYGVAKATLLRSWTGWTDNEDLNHDLAVVVLDRNVGDRTGWMGREAGVTTSALNFDGYPAETPYVPSGETRQYPGFDAGNVVFYTTYRIRLDAYTYGGHSGGPAWRYDGTNRYIQGVNSTSNRAGSAEETRIDSGKFRTISSWISADPNPTARPDVWEWLIDNAASKSFSPSSVPVGGTLNVVMNALNGGQASTGTVYYDVYLSTNDNISEGDYKIGTATTGALGAWSGYTSIARSFTIPSMPTGLYYVGYIMRTGTAEYSGKETCTTAGTACDNIVLISNSRVTITAAASPSPSPSRSPSASPSPSRSPSASPSPSPKPSVSPQPGSPSPRPSASPSPKPSVPPTSQIIDSSVNPVVGPSQVVVPVRYDVSSGDNTLSGIGVRVHFNSSHVSWVKNDAVYSNGLTACDTSPQNDTGNYDGDATTDKYVSCAWVDIAGNWPNVALPLNHLMDVRFQFITGTMPPGSSTTVRYSASSTAAGYGFFSTPTTLTVGNPCNLDVDGNGLADALTDGLLTMRYEFGFTGTSLIGGAVGSGCTRCTAAAIETYLGQCKASGTIDIDGNSAIDALTDGLLTMRYEFGFTGTSLISGAVGSGCTRCTAAAIESYLFSLKP